MTISALHPGRASSTTGEREGLGTRLGTVLVWVWVNMYTLWVSLRVYSVGEDARSPIYGNTAHYVGSKVMCTFYCVMMLLYTCSVHSDVISPSYYVCPNTLVIFTTTLSYYQSSIYQPIRYSCTHHYWVAITMATGFPSLTSETQTHVHLHSLLMRWVHFLIMLCDEPFLQDQYGEPMFMKHCSRGGTTGSCDPWRTLLFQYKLP